MTAVADPDVLEGARATLLKIKDLADAQLKGFDEYERGDSTPPKVKDTPASAPARKEIIRPDLDAAIRAAEEDLRTSDSNKGFAWTFVRNQDESERQDLRPLLDEIAKSPKQRLDVGGYVWSVSKGRFLNRTGPHRAEESAT